MKIDYTEITVKLMKDYTAKYLQENAELVQDTIKATQEALAISRVVCCARCGETLSDEMLEEQKDEIEMDCDALCKKHWEDDKLYMADLVMY